MPAPIKLVQPRQPFSVEWDGYPQTFNPGRVFESDHPLVKQYPDLFVACEPLPFDKVDRG